MNKFVVCTSIGLITAITALWFARSIFKEKGKKCVCRNRVKNKVIAITGANSGIGFESALQLATYGAVVYLCCRNKKLGERAASTIRKQTKNNRVYFVHLDLCSLQSCHECVTLLFIRETKVDILIHNAGVFCADPKLTVDEFELHYQTNFLGPVAFTERILPLLLESPNPRVIFTTSEAHKIVSGSTICATDFTRMPALVDFSDQVKHYGLTKLGLKLYAGYFADINRDLNFIITSVNPGNVWTGIYRRCWTRWYNWPMRFLCSLLMKTPKEGAQNFIHAANSDAIRNGSYIDDCEETYPFVTPEEITAAKILMQEIYNVLNIT